MYFHTAFVGMVGTEEGGACAPVEVERSLPLPGEENIPPETGDAKGVSDTIALVFFLFYFVCFCFSSSFPFVTLIHFSSMLFSSRTRCACASSGTSCKVSDCGEDESQLRAFFLRGKRCRSLATLISTAGFRICRRY